MRYCTLLLGMVFLFGAAVLSAQKNPVNFAGEWTLDAEKSDQGETAGGRRSMLAFKLVVEQKDDTLSVESFRKNRDGADVSMKSAYTLDGKECKNESENRSSVSTVKWTEDGKSLAISSKTTVSRGGQDFSMDSIEIWSLDGGMLIVATTTTSSRGERKTKGVYNKAG